MREIETSLQQFGEFLLRARLVREKAAPHCVRWVRRFLKRQASDEPLPDQIRRFCEDLERNGRVQDWQQVRQVEQALRIFIVNFLKRTDWKSSPRRLQAGRLRRGDSALQLVSHPRHPTRTPGAVAWSGSVAAGRGVGSARRVMSMDWSLLS